MLQKNCAVHSYKQSGNSVQELVNTREINLRDDSSTITMLFFVYYQKCFANHTILNLANCQK
jgi:hypothetical protein